MKKSSKQLLLLAVVSILLVFVSSLVFAETPSHTTDDMQGDSLKKSHRLIVELEAPSLAVWAKTNRAVLSENGRLNAKSTTAQQYISSLRAEQATFAMNMTSVLPNASVSHFINETGNAEQASYQVVLNAVTIDPGETDLVNASKSLLKLDGVKNVYFDYAHYPTMYTSTHLVNAPVVWDLAGGQANGGAGVKVASMDGGLHHKAPMFSNEDGAFECPEGFPLPDNDAPDAVLNNNCKIILSRVYFRSWDLPKVYTASEIVYDPDKDPDFKITLNEDGVEDEAQVWPGGTGTSHGVHTGGTASGRIVDATYAGLEVGEMSGMAPGAWSMSYRVFYDSVNDDGSFYNAEGIAALEDIAIDGADVVQNSWGGGASSVGGKFDALDMALINASCAGVFVSMSAGNAGPGYGTTDHPSDKYLTVAASTHGGNFASGRLNITAPEPVDEDLIGLSYAAAPFGGLLELNKIYTHEFVTSDSIDPANFESCNPWPTGTFDGKAAIISRGACEFGVKVLNAENAGAVFVVVRNHANGGDALTNMGAGEVGDQVTVPAIFIGHTNGLNVVDWYADHASETPVLSIDTFTFQAGNDEPDQIAAFSSRGPAVNNSLNPDIAAPGVAILSQGYTPSVDGEARHLGYGQAGGTSMAGPHVAGAAALLRGLHPEWTNEQIKSALMSTSKYMDIHNFDGTPAQPLDMGAGRLDLTHASDPGVFLAPQSVAFGKVLTGEVDSRWVWIESASATTETYSLSTLYTGDSFTATTELPGITVEPASLTLAPGEVTTIEVTFDSSAIELGDNQGYVILTNDNYEAHFPVWGRVMPKNDTPILIIDHDVSPFNYGDYIGYYTSTLDNLGYSYDVWDADSSYWYLPSIETLLSYKAIILQTGDNYYDLFDDPETDNLTEYANNGGVLIVMGQDASGVLGETFVAESILNINSLQDSVTNNTLPYVPVVSAPDVPPIFHDVVLDLSGMEDGDGARNQIFVDELKVSGEPYVPPVVHDNNSYYVPMPLFIYPDDSYWMEDGIVGIASRQQPTLENPGITGLGRSIFTSFGLEGVNNTEYSTSREELLDKMLKWGWDTPYAIVTGTVHGMGVEVEAGMFDGLGESYEHAVYRWDFGDGSEFTEFTPFNKARHNYQVCGLHTVHVEAIDALGNHAVAKFEVDLTDCHTPYALAINVVPMMNHENFSKVISFTVNSGHWETDLFTAGDYDWTTLSPTNTLTLGPGERTKVHVATAIPFGTIAGKRNVTKFTAIDSDGVMLIDIDLPITVGCRFDFDNNGRRSILDLARVASHFGDNYNPMFDFNHDEVINIEDLTRAVGVLNLGCAAPGSE